ncbi:hypothetical protein Acr_29g0011260 [Actinidia rufa]|uniref:Uncharacterized protein n=1 Tax=Actinidia rufa TaxID=165716 RepID=A0A7J0HGH4_9ERIC|nr:hypothetical protein Acr_29g0011260 [Actinidia rufa]
MVGCLDFLRALCCGLRADCCEVRLRGKTERDCERGRCFSRRYGAPAPNRVGNEVRTRPHVPFEDRRVRLVSATRPGRSHALSRAWGRTHAPARAKERLPRAATCQHAPRVGRTRDHARPRAEGEQFTCFTRQVATRTRHTSGRGRPLARDCPKYKAQDQSSDTAATTVMADEDEIDVLLAASDNGKSDWVLDSGSAYHLCRDIELLAEGQSGFAWQTGDSKGCSFDASGGTLRVSKGNKEMLWRKKTRGLYRLEGNVQTGGATVRHGSSSISEKNGQGKQPLHRVVRTREKRWSYDNSQSDVTLRRTPMGCVGHPSGGAGHLGEKVQALRCGGAYTSVGSGVAH